MRTSLVAWCALMLAGAALAGCREEPTFVITFAPMDGGSDGATRAATTVAVDAMAARDGAARSVTAASDAGSAAKVDGGGGAAATAADGGAAKAVGGESGDACRKDVECAVVDESCCTCSGGSHRIAIAATKKLVYERALAKRCAGQACVDIFMDKAECRATAICRAGHCALEIPHEGSRVLPKPKAKATPAK